MLLVVVYRRYYKANALGHVAHCRSLKWTGGEKATLGYSFTSVAGGIVFHDHGQQRRVVGAGEGAGWRTQC